MILDLENNKLLLVFNKRYGLADFRAASRVVAGTYADELVERIYNHLFRHSRDLRTEYQKYYAVEYADISEFLYWKYEVDKHVAENIMNGIQDTTFVAFARGVGDLFADEIGASVLNRILAELGETR